MVPEREKTSKKKPCAAASATETAITVSMLQSSNVIRSTPFVQVDDKLAHTSLAFCAQCRMAEREQGAACSTGSTPGSRAQTACRTKAVPRPADNSRPARSERNRE